MLPMAGVFLVAWLVLVTSISLRYMRRLKTVYLEGQLLIVQGWGQEIAIPISSVVETKASRWLSPEEIRLTLREPTAFGQTIVFIPKLRWFHWPFSTHPMAQELRRIVSEARGASTHVGSAHP